MEIWILAISYWIHLLATVVWLGGMALIALVAWPALRAGSLGQNQWLQLQRRFAPWANASLVLLLITGFVQMTNDENYTGFLNVDSLWAWAVLVKHIAVLAMMLIAGYAQLRLYPAMDRALLLAQKKPALAASEQDNLVRTELRLLRVNLFCAAGVLLFTAIATAV
jgi:uncharacterized membrane protein